MSTSAGRGITSRPGQARHGERDTPRLIQLRLARPYRFATGRSISIATPREMSITLLQTWCAWNRSKARSFLISTENIWAYSLNGLSDSGAGH